MKLAEWLKEKSVSRTEFARRIAVSPALITALCSETVWPGHDTASAIARETKDEVTPTDFLRTPPTQDELPDVANSGAA
jgi:3,4-dihydroxy 2-butanone 4-phosphate synthase/GTP cyclohydrolase II